MKTAVINYGMGNLKSVYNALTHLGGNPVIADDPSVLATADRIVLPGVGAYSVGMNNLMINGWTEALEKAVIRDGRLFLGICLGMQLMMEVGTENGLTEGLGWLPGSVNIMKSEDKEFRVPHIGWNDVQFVKQDGLYQNIEGGKDFYFVHSFAVQPQDENHISGICDYFGPFVASVEHENLLGTQFHPEKSHKAGLAVLENFTRMKV